MPHLKLELNEQGYGKILIDGQEIKNCIQVKLDSQPGDLAKVTLTIWASVEVDAPVDLVVNRAE